MQYNLAHYIDSFFFFVVYGVDLYLHLIAVCKKESFLESIKMGERESKMGEGESKIEIY